MIAEYILCSNQVRRQLPVLMGGVARVTADATPLWQPEDVRMYTRDEVRLLKLL